MLHQILSFVIIYREYSMVYGAVVVRKKGPQFFC